MKQPYHSFCCPAVTHKLIIGREESIYIGHTKFRRPKIDQGDWTLSTGRLFSLQTIIPSICPSIHPWAYLEPIFCVGLQINKDHILLRGTPRRLKMVPWSTWGYILIRFGSDQEAQSILEEVGQSLGLGSKGEKNQKSVMEIRGGIWTPPCPLSPGTSWA